MAQHFLIGDQITNLIVVEVFWCCCFFVVVVNKAQLHPKYIKKKQLILVIELASLSC